MTNLGFLLLSYSGTNSSTNPYNPQLSHPHEINPRFVVAVVVLVLGGQ